MKATRFANRAWAFVLAVLMTLTLIAPQALAANTVDPVEPASGKILVSQTDYTLIDGVTESDIFLNTKEGNAQIAGFMTTIAPGAKATFKASYNGYYTEGSTPASRKDKAANLAWSMEKTTLQAANYTKATGGNVIMAMNGDYYNMQTAQPLGYLIMEGNLIQKNNGVANEPYFAVLKDGTYAIRDAGTDCSDVLEAISGPFYLIKDGQPCYNGNPDLMPRNCIGIKADGTVVTFLADGRQSPYSVGMTIDEEISFLYAQGVVNAIFLDGGGSATCATKREGTTDLQIRNRPSDGVERTVSSALLLVSTAESDGVFDHASLSPNNTVYTPNSQRGLTRLMYRMCWEEDFRMYVKRLDEQKPVIICGDMNVAHREIDLKNPKTNVNNAGFTPQERGAMTKLLESGFVDTFRYLYPDAAGRYSWWSYMFNARANNAGWRIDYFLVSDRIKNKIIDARIDDTVLGSDHCPVVLEIDL